jgi:STE24 endopeptidase
MTPTGFNAEAATQAYIDSLGPEVLEQAAGYTTVHHWFMIGSLLVGGVTAWLIVRIGWLRAIERRFGQRPNAGVFVIGVVYVLASAALTVPWRIGGWWFASPYNRFDVTLGDFLSGLVWEAVFNVVVVPVLLVLLYLFIRKVGKAWWVWGGALGAGAISLQMLLMPIYIMPMFYEYEPLPDGEVRDAVEIIAMEADIPTDRIYVFDGSSQTSNFNAEAGGIGPSARLAISDVAFGEVSLDEVKSVTAHEVGHYVLGHIWYRIALVSVMSVLLFFLAARIFPGLASLFGAHPDIARASGLPVLVLIASMLTAAANPIFNTASRWDNIEADQYSLDTVGLPDAMAAALVNRVEYRNPRPQGWEEALFYTHPSVERRVRMAMEWKAENMAEDE